MLAPVRGIIPTEQWPIKCGNLDHQLTIQHFHRAYESESYLMFTYILDGRIYAKLLPTVDALSIKVSVCVTVVSLGPVLFSSPIGTLL